MIDTELKPDELMTVPEVCKAVRKSKPWLCSPAGRAVFGPGLLVGRSRLYRRSHVLGVLSRAEEAAQ